VPLGQLADRIVAFLRERRGDLLTLTTWRERNRHALREFWARAPGDALGVNKSSRRRWRRPASRQNNRPRERPGDSMIEPAQHATPHVGIFWAVQTSNGETQLLAAGCPLDQAEPYGDCLTFGPGHCET
jgi:hypothetical protein